MFGRLNGWFGSEASSPQKEDVSNSNNNNVKENIANAALVERTLRRFWDPYSICEVDCVIRVARHFLGELDADAEDFDRQFDTIVIGAIVGAKVTASMQTFAKLTYEDLTDDEFQAVFGDSYLGGIGYREDDQEMHKFLVGLGERVLDGRLPFDAKLINTFHLSEDIDLLKRLNVYRPDIVADDQVLTTREQKLIELLQQERTKTAELTKQLAKAEEKESNVREKLEGHQREKLFRKLDQAQKKNHFKPSGLRRK